MSNPPSDGGIADDFFDQLFSMPATFTSNLAAAAAGGVPGAESAMSLHLGAAGAEPYPPPPVFPLGLSLDHASAKRHRDDPPPPPPPPERDAVQLGSFFPAFGLVQPHQIRPSHPPPVFHGHASQGGGGMAAQPPAPRPRVRARRGQATDPHSIAERLRRERIAERLRALQELVPNTNKTDRAAMLDEILDYVKFLRLQVKVLSMSRLGGTGAVAQLVADIPLSSLEGSSIDEGGSKQQVWEKWSTDGTERQVAKLMDEDVGAAMQFLQSKALCMMPISLATAIYHTNQQPESPSVKPEPNTPS